MSSGPGISGLKAPWVAATPSKGCCFAPALLKRVSNMHRREAEVSGYRCWDNSPPKGQL